VFDQERDALLPAPTGHGGTGGSVEGAGLPQTWDLAVADRSPAALK